MQFQRFNDKGISAFDGYLKRLREEPTLSPPFSLLEDSSASEPVHPSIEAEPKPFENRLEFAHWLHEASTEADTRIPLQDAGFWSWLTLLLFDQVCPQGERGRAVRERARYMPQLNDKRRYYRHALLGPYLVYRQYADESRAVASLLCGRLDKLTDEAYRLFVENQLVVHNCAVLVLSDLYFDDRRNRLRKGAQSKTKPGSIRRLAKILAQYSRTYDLDILSATRLMEMLPTEFDQWRENSQPNLSDVG